MTLFFDVIRELITPGGILFIPLVLIVTLGAFTAWFWALDTRKGGKKHVQM